MGNTSQNASSDADNKEQEGKACAESNAANVPIHMTVNANSYLSEEFKEKDKLKWKLDASAIGCAGIFWRISPSMFSISPESDWPRNGTTLYGWKSTKNTGWIKVDDRNSNHWLPIKQQGKTVLHTQQ